MTSAYRANKVASDADIIRLNSVGLSLSTIGKILGVHATSVSIRMKALRITPADTRRSFMEDVFKRLSNDQQEWLADQLGPHTSIKDFITNLLVSAHMNQGKKK